MVNAGRVACIFTPFVLTLASLACLVVLILGGSRERNATLDDLFFAKIDLSNITLSSSANLASAASAAGSNVTALDGAILRAKQALNMSDYYTIYLRGYCRWNGNDQYAVCSDPTTTHPFEFDPISIWGLNETGQDLDQILPKTFTDGLSAYKKGSAAMYYLFALALLCDAVTALVGISAIFSRWGSLFTTIFADIATVLTIGGALTATIMFPILAGALNKELKDNYGVETTVGTRGLSLAWIAVAFATGAGLFWTFTICCCSGRSPYKGYKEDRRTKAEKTPYTYERVGSPYLGPRNDQSVPLSTFNLNSNRSASPHLQAPTHSGYGAGPSGVKDSTAYEPFRSHA